MERVCTFKIEMNDLEGNIKKFKNFVRLSRRWSFYGNFEYFFIFNKHKFYNSGDLLTSVHSFLLHLENKDKNFFCFSDENRYDLYVNLVDQNEVIVGIGESNFTREEFVLQKNIFFSTILNTFEHFISRLYSAKIDDKSFKDFITKTKLRIKNAKHDLEN